MNRIDLAVLEFNRKFSAMEVYLMYEKKMTEPEAERRAIDLMQNDIQNLQNMAGKKLFYDDNYTQTWGFGSYGAYDDFDEASYMEHVIDPGWQI